MDIVKYLDEKATQLAMSNSKPHAHVIVLRKEMQRLGQRDGCVYYAVVEGQAFYKTLSMLEAVDIFLRAAFVFALQFLNAAHSSWSFLQKAVYNIAIKYDSTSSKVLKLITDTQ